MCPRTRGPTGIQHDARVRALRRGRHRHEPDSGRQGSGRRVGAPARREAPVLSLPERPRCALAVSRAPDQSVPASRCRRQRRGRGTAGGQSGAYYSARGRLTSASCRFSTVCISAVCRPPTASCATSWRPCALRGSDRVLVTIVTADHGEHFGEHQLIGHAFSVREELVHVPLVVHGTEAAGAVARAGSRSRHPGVGARCLATAGSPETAAVTRVSRGRACAAVSHAVERA